MSTPYSKIKKRYLRKITDYKLSFFTDAQKDEIILELLDSACGEFERLCKHDLNNRDDNVEEFIEDLTSNEITILSELMVNEWLKPFANSEDLLVKHMTTRDYAEYANSNQMNSVSSIATKSEIKCDKLLKNYSYNFGEMDKVGANNG